MRLKLKSSRRAFTLIELILVMALLTIVISLVTPSLMKFFGGRSEDSEVRQFVALTRYAQSRAVSEGSPMFLWVNPKGRSYGLSLESGYADKDPHPQKYTIAAGLSINVDLGTAKPSVKGQVIGIHFSPDGNVITSTSVRGVSIQQDRNPPVWIRPAANGLSYEAQTSNGH